MLIYDDQKRYLNEKNEETYTMFIPEDNLWRRMNKAIDFASICDNLKDKYPATTGRSTAEITRMFKYLLLKSHYKISDESLIEKTETDLEFRYFLEYDPIETDEIDSSLLTSFRREKVQETDDFIGKLTMSIEKLFDKRGRSQNSKTNFKDLDLCSFLNEELKSTIEKINAKVEGVDVPKKSANSAAPETDREYGHNLLAHLTKNTKMTKNRNLLDEVNYLKELLEDLDYLQTHHTSTAKEHYMSIQQISIIFLAKVKETIAFSDVI